MVLLKTAYAKVDPERLVDTDEILARDDLDIHNRMKKFADNLKVIAPQAKDFLYFTCIMMHAAEAALYDEHGHLKKDASGNPVTASWEPTNNGGIKWVCSDPNIKPVKNNNGDIFNESELKKAYKKWVGKPLCLDHKSSSVDYVRGVIVDTVYDDKRKRVIALCALDKKNYPDLADKVSSGVSDNVSMGTAVGRAVCTEDGCHRVARTESDFCEHMRRKSGYGEINLDLSPLELSLVVSGADPGAKIKHIIAKDLTKATESLENYLKGKIAVGAIDEIELANIKEDLQKLTERVNKLTEGDSGAEKTDDNAAYGVTESRKEMGESELPGVTQIQSGVEEWPSYASELQKEILGLRTKLASLQGNVNKLSGSFKNGSEEKTMSREKNAYMQGTVEPNVGGVTYPPEPGEQRARMEDKHMVGAGPFPGVGDVDGQYPGISHNDADLRRELQRQAEENRNMRNALLARAKEQLKSNAYFQGTEDPKSYEVDPTEGKARKEDKHMVGQKPFPGVGDVEGLHPSPASADEKDELKRKEMLSRAELNAKFRKVSTPEGQLDKAASRWDVYANGHLVLSTTVDQITRGNSDVLYDQIATKTFGKQLLDNVRADYKATVTKYAQMAQPAAPAPVAAPEAPPMDMEVPEGAGSGEDQMKNLVQELNDLHEDMGKVLDDIKDAAGVVADEEGDLEGEIPAGDDTFAEAEMAPEKMTTASVKSMRARVHGMLKSSFTEATAELKAHANEIKHVRELYKGKYSSMDKSQKEYFNALAEESVKDAKECLADSIKLIGSFVKYAQGNEGLMKRAEPEIGMETPIKHPLDALEGTEGYDDLDKTLGDYSDEGLSDDYSVDDYSDSADGDYSYDLDADLDKMEKDWKKNFEKGLEDVTKKPVEYPKLPDPKLPVEAPEAEALDKGQADDYSKDLGQKLDKAVKSPMEYPKLPDPKLPAGAPAPKDKNEVKVEIPEGADVDVEKLPAGTTISAADLNTREGRAMSRVKLAQKGLQFSDMLGKAHPDGSKEVPGLDVKPTAAGSKFHVLEDVHDAMMNLANMPPKVRKQAEQIAKFVEAGKIDASDVDQLVAHGVDKDAVTYYKQYWGQAKDTASNDFASKLTQEHQNQKRAEEAKKHQLRVKQAYDLAYQMRDRGIIETSQLEDQVNESLTWNDAGFESVRRMVSRQPVVKKASMPSVGLLSSDQVILPSAEGSVQSSPAEDLKSYFSAYFANKKF